ncbi:MAG: glycoside hydrolase [Actinomycetota bacterium]|nr:glycoside hydrolase [Actinomycetota bacterium]
MLKTFRRMWPAVVGAAAVSLLLVQGTAGAASSVRVTKPVDATKDSVDPQRTFSAPFLLVSPTDSRIMVAGTVEFRTNKCQLLRSVDGGKAWRFFQSPPEIAGLPFCLANNSNIFQAPLAWGRNGALYMAHLGYNLNTRSQRSVLLFKSFNLGDSWTSTIVRDARTTSGVTTESDAPPTGLVVDTKSGPDDIVYVGYRQGYPKATAPNAHPQEPGISVSKDGGVTFAPTSFAVGDIFATASTRNAALTARTTLPSTTTTVASSTTTTVNPATGTTLSPTATTAVPTATTAVSSSTTTTAPPAGSRAATPNQLANFGAASNGEGLTLDDKGNFYVAFMSGSANITPSPPSALVVSRSGDQAKTWTSFLARPFSYENLQNPRMAWSPGGGPNGTLHLVYEGAIGKAQIASFADVFYLRSTDMGQTWSAPVRLADDDPAALSGKYLPNVVVAPNGRVDVVWWDTRNDPGIRGNDVYYTYSTDDGATWAKNIRMTDQTVDRRFGVWSNNFDQNSPPSLASTNAVALVGWDDTRFSTGPAGQVLAADPVNNNNIGVGGGVQDIFVSAVQFSAIHTGGSKAPKYLLAAAIGLLVAGAVLLVAALARRRRETPAASVATGRS